MGFYYLSRSAALEVPEGLGLFSLAQLVLGYQINPQNGFYDRGGQSEYHR